VRGREWGRVRMRAGESVEGVWQGVQGVQGRGLMCHVLERASPDLVWFFMKKHNA